MQKLILNYVVEWTDPLARACFAMTGWATCLALLAMLHGLALKVLLNTTKKVKCSKELKSTVVLEVGHLQREVGHFTKKIFHSTRYHVWSP